MVEAVAARLEVLACTLQMAVLELRQEVECLPPMLLLVAELAGHASARQPEPLAAVAGRPALLALLVLHLLRAGCLDKVAAAVAVVVLAQEVLAVQAVAALAAAAVAQHAVHTPPARVVSAVMAGHWWWSSDYGSLCRC